MIINALKIASKESILRLKQFHRHPSTNLTVSLVALTYSYMQDDYCLNFPFVVGAHPRNEIWCPDVLGIEDGTADRMERCATRTFHLI